MFDIEKHCLTEQPNDDYILVYRYIAWNTYPVFHEPLILDMDPVSGILKLKSPAGKIQCKLSKLYENYPGLQEFFHLASLHDGLIKFYTARYPAGIDINIYLYKPLFTIPVYLPSTFDPYNYRLPALTVRDAVNERINADYNGMFQHDLHDYQQNNIAWMVGIEELTRAKCNLLQYPMLRELGLLRVNYNNGTLLYNPNTRFVYPTSHEDNIPIKVTQLLGGVLADEVGLGKTFSMYGLIINTLDREIGFWDRKPTKRMLAAEAGKWEEILGPIGPENIPITPFTSHATLIIGPSRLTGQWMTELDKFMVPLHDLRVYDITTITKYRKLTAAELCNADIVIVSDRFLTNSNYYRYIHDTSIPNRFRLHDFYWKRIIIDEGHEFLASDFHTISVGIRNELYRFKSQYRWLCTGTPFPHEYDSLDHYLYFLSGYKYNLNDYKMFDTETINSFLQQNIHRNTYQNIENQIYIPPIKQTTVLLTQDPIERALYVNAVGETTRMIQLCTSILVSGVDSSIINDTMTTLEDVRQRMSDHYQTEIDSCQRQIIMAKTERRRAKDLHADAGNLYEIDSVEYRDYRSGQKTIIRNWSKKIKEYTSTVESMQARKKLFDTFEQRVKRDPCVICYGEMVDAVLTKCSHIFCRGCMQRVIDNSPHNIICPMCRTELRLSTDIGYTKTEDAKESDSEYHHHVQKWGTKMAWLVQYLKEVMDDPNNRIIIFSQWKKMLQLVGTVLNEVGIKQVYLSGTAGQLAKNITRFKTSPDIRTIMLSSETCSSGSNLTEASHIILLDTVNGTASQAKAIEDQAIGRAARLGQTKNVQVVRLIMNDTIEYDYYKENIDQDGVVEVYGSEGVTI